MSDSIDWYLHRKNCSACSKSEAWLNERGVSVVEQIDARKQRFNEDEAWQLLAGCTKVCIARGKAWAAYDPADAEQKAEIGKKMLGPHGTLRAPAIRIGQTFLIGFHDEMYDQGI